MEELERHPYDRSSKWLIQHHGDSILRLAKITDVKSWRPAQAEIVQPRQLPDGLLEVRLRGKSQDDLFLLEVATYPERRVSSQLTRDTMLVYLDRENLPEVVVLVLHPKGRYRIPNRVRLRSPCGLTECTLTRRVVELWKVPAEELLQAGDVGLIPWVMLAKTSAPPEQLARRCREVIDKHAPLGEHENFLAVVQVLARLRYNEAGVLTILGGRQTMIESPLIQEIIAEALHEAILDVLRSRLGDVPADVENKLRSILNQRRLTDLNRRAANCSSLDDFRKALKRAAK